MSKRAPRDLVGVKRYSEKPERWMFVVDVPGKDGKRHQARRRGFATQKEAKEARDAFLGKTPTHKTKAEKALTVGEWARQWLESAAKWSTKKKGTPAKESSLATWRTLIETQIDPAIGALRLSELSPDALNRFYADLLVGGRRDGKGGLAASSVAKIHTCIHLFLAQAVREGKADRNVAGDERVQVPGSARPVVNTWNAEEVRTFLTSVRDDRLFAAFALVLSTGLRRGELLGLAWRDIDLVNGWLNVRQELLSVNFAIKLSDPKSFAGRRSIALDPESVEVLRAHRLRQLKERDELDMPAQQPDDYVFAGIEGEPLHPGLFSDIWDRRVKKAAVKRIRLHDARHTHASLLLAQGVSPKVVQERLGHANVAITLAIYSHTSPDLQREAAAKIGSLILREAIVTKV
jgi:integrase